MKYKIVAKREIHYELDIEAASEAEAMEEMNRKELVENIEDYAWQWGPLKILEITFDEE